MTDNLIKQVQTCTNMQGWVVTDGGNISLWPSLDWPFLQEMRTTGRYQSVYFLGVLWITHWTMPLYQLEDICCFLGSGPLAIKAHQLKTDHTAAFCNIRDLFLINWRQKFIPKFIVLWHEQAFERSISRAIGQWVMSMQQESKSLHVILSVLGAKLYHGGLNSK